MLIFPLSRITKAGARQLQNSLSQATAQAYANSAAFVLFFKYAERPLDAFVPGSPHVIRVVESRPSNSYQQCHMFTLFCLHCRRRYVPTLAVLLINTVVLPEFIEQVSGGVVFSYQAHHMSSLSRRDGHSFPYQDDHT